MFEQSELKGQKKDGKRSMCRASIFRDLRNLTSEDQIYLLDSVLKGERSIKEMAVEAKEFKKMRRA